MREDTPNKSTLNITKCTDKCMKEEPIIKGYVTVIKNAGRPDEQVLCKDKPKLKEKMVTVRLLLLLK